MQSTATNAPEMKLAADYRKKKKYAEGKYYKQKCR